MKKKLAAASFSALLAIVASSTSSGFANWNTKYWANEKNFNRISSFNVSDNLPKGSKSTTKTSSEVVTASEDGKTLMYTDSDLGVVGLVDISDPAKPKALGVVELEAEPTGIAALGNNAYIGSNTSESYTNPSGALVQYNLETRKAVKECDLGGQPDSVFVSPDGTFLAVAIENERDEEYKNGFIPQIDEEGKQINPPGYVSLVKLNKRGKIQCNSIKKVDLTGLSEIAPSDPEPEFVAINDLGETVVSLQENNHLAVIDKDGNVISHFSAGVVKQMAGMDTKKDGAHKFKSKLKNVRREPDGLTWIDNDHFATANEGDYKHIDPNQAKRGGSRSWTIFKKDGTVVYEDANRLERAIAQIGHFQDGRAGKKGVEPESVTYSKINGTPYLFVGAERAGIVAVYDITELNQPLLTQLLPSGIGPEGFVAIPERGLIASANEKDYNKKEPGLSSHVTIYQLQDAPASYPHLTNENGLEFVSWGAISGMVAGDDGKIYAVNDGTFKTQPRIYVIDPSSSPALLERAIDIKLDGKTALFMDQEGITTDGNGGFYISTEGIKKKLDEHPPAIYHVSSDGEILEKITPPPSYLNYAKNPGFEGITRNGDILYIAQQKPWGDDTFNTTKILSYNLKTKQWGAVNYQLDRIKKGGVGISELTYHDGALYVIERDSFYGKKAKLKAIYKIDLDDVIFEGLQTNIPPRLYPLVEKELVTDLKPVMKSTGGFILEKVEGLAITSDGQAWISTDNDGTGKKSTGETLFLNIGKI